MQPSATVDDCRWLSQTGDDHPASAPSDGGGKPPPNPYSGVGAAYVLAGSVLVGLGIGWLIDRNTGATPKWTVGMTMLFLGVGLYQMVKEALRK